MLGRPVDRWRSRFYPQRHEAAGECNPPHRRRRGTGSVTASSPMAFIPANAPSEIPRDQPPPYPPPRTGEGREGDTPTGPPLGIICGAGTVPFAVADAVMRRGRPVVLFALRGWADATAVKAYAHHWIALGQFGRICRVAHQEG